MMPLEEIRQIKSSKKDLKKFGLTIGIVVLLIGVFLFFRQKGAAVYWGGTGMVLMLLSFSAPVVLKPLAIIWMAMSILLGWVMTGLLLTIFFYIVLTPTGLIVRLFGKDLLDRKVDRDTKSYWQKKRNKKFDPQDYERQF
jgi:hypothetical protein